MIYRRLAAEIEKRPGLKSSKATRDRIFLWSFFVVIAGLTTSYPHVIQARPFAEIQQTGELRVCLAPVHPAIVNVEPADCRSDCRFSGAAYDTALAFVATLKGDIKPTFRRVDWDEQFFDENQLTVQEASYTPALLASGDCDLYPSHLTVTDWRLKKLVIVPLFQSRMMVIVNKARREQFQTPADLAGKTTAVTKDTSFHSWLQAQNQGPFADNPVQITLVGMGESLSAVDAGRAGRFRHHRCRRRDLVDTPSVA